MTEADGRAFDLFGAAFFTTNTFTDWNGNEATETKYFDEQGAKLGSSNTNTNSWTDWNTQETITSTNTNYNGPNGNWLGSEWEDSNDNSGWNTQTVDQVTSFDFDGDGDVDGEDAITVRIERGENTNTWTDLNNQIQTETSSFERYYVNDDTWTFLGGQETRNGETTTWDANWNEIGRTFDTSGLTEVLSEADGRAFDLFGAAFFKTDTFTDWNGNEATETSYFDAQGNKLGSSNTNTWEDATFSSTNTSYQDANWNWVGSEWSDTYGSGWETRTEEPITFDFDGDGTVTADETDLTVVVERREWTEAEQTTPQESHEYYYSTETNNFLGGTETRNGNTTVYGENWEIISSDGGGDTGSDIFTVTLDINPADTLVGTFTQGEESLVELHDLNGDDTIDQMVMTGSWIDETSQTQTWTDTFAVVWSDNLTDWTAYYTETIAFDPIAGYDEFGRPLALISEEGEPPLSINWHDAPVDGVVASLSFTEIWDDGMEHQVDISLVDTDATPDGWPNEVRISEDGIEVEVMMITGMATGALGQPVSMDLQATIGEDILYGSATFNDTGMIQTVSVSHDDGTTPADDGTTPPPDDGTTPPPDGIDNIAPYHVGASLAEDGSGAVILKFSEAVIAGEQFGLTLYKNPDLNDNEGGWSSPSLEITGIEGWDSNVLTITTNTTFTDTDVVRLNYDNGVGDQAGNPMDSLELWIGGSGSSIIDLDNYGSWMPVVLRGNGGADTLVGTDARNMLVDGGGADLLLGGGDADVIRLIENGGLVREDGTTGPGYSRDTIMFEPGESVFPAFDVITGSGTSPEGTGFDIWSSNLEQHDVLDLTHAVIATTNGIDADGMDVGSITTHNITDDGMVTYKDASGNAILVTPYNAADVAAYSQTNIQNATGAFLMDTDGDGTTDSTVVFQCLGPIIDSTVVMLKGVEAQALGTNAGMGVIQIQDTQAPEDVSWRLTTMDNGDGTVSYTGVVLDFTEHTYITDSLALTLFNTDGSTMEYTVDGSGTHSLTFEFVTSLTAEDWYLGSYAATDAATGFADANGNWIQPESDEKPWAEGMDGNNTIDLSGLVDPDPAGYDIIGNGGDDILIGSIYDDFIEGGGGVDTMTGGQGGDEFYFAQGDLPVLNWSDVDTSTRFDDGDIFVAAGGGMDVITDFGVGDGIYLDLPNSLEEYDPSTGTETYSPVGHTGVATVQGSYNDAGSFSVGTDGADTLVVYDGDPSSSVDLSGLVLTGITQVEVYGNYLTVMTDI